MDDNLSLSEKIKARYRSMYSGVFFLRYIKGLWAVAEGVIYDMFRHEDRHVVDSIELPQQPVYYVSCDYGTQNATVFLLWCKALDSRWACIREYYYSGRDTRKQKTDSEFADDLKEWLRGIVPERVIVDPAAASFHCGVEEAWLYREERRGTMCLMVIRVCSNATVKPGS